MRQAESRVVPAGALGNGQVEKSLVKMVRGRSSGGGERNFLLIVGLSVLAHVVLMVVFSKYQVKPAQVTIIEEVPERFAKLIIEKPIPKIVEVKNSTEKASTQEAATTVKSEVKPTTGGPVTAAAQTKAKRSVDARVARVEQKLRTVGVLGMLTGVGTTAKGPSVVDVLGSLNNKKESTVDLEDALDKMTGLQKTKSVDVLDKKLAKSKDLSVSRKESIDDLLANVGRSDAVDLVKKGSFVIQKPESIEGAASSNARRDNGAINAIVSTHKTSIRMSYEKYLKRDPSLAGKITIRFTISASGSVTKTEIVENTTGNSDLEEEIIRKIRMWKFEPITDGDVSVTYPFVFSSAG